MNAASNAFDGNGTPLKPTGEEFARDRHLYQFDRQVLGERSLFSLLCTTRSQAGAARLSTFLLDSAEWAETKARQEAVRELREATQLREEISVLGKYQFHGCDPDVLHAWIATPLLRVQAASPLFLFISGASALLIAILCVAQFLGWTYWLPILVLLILAQVAVSAPLFKRVRSRIKMLRTLSNEFGVLRQGMQLLQRQTFLSSKLEALARRSRETGACLHLSRLEHLLQGIVQREKPFLAFPSLLVAAGTQLVLAIERWRATHQEQLKEWIDIWAEFEALNAIACYAWENPSDTFPEFINGSTMFEAQSLGHPMLPSDKCVRNDLALNDTARFYVLSGSNMAGKSTLLEAVGINVVLAYAGAPVRASHARIDHFTLCASNSVSDSLLEGKSKFLAEAERLQATLGKASLEKPVLFLFDEILSGTNSADRRFASEEVVRALIAGGAVGILSTHDLSLTEIADLPGLGGVNCCMESESGQPLKFDYRVKLGASRRTSAWAILRMVGIHTRGPSG
jgi:hypothetical protein